MTPYPPYTLHELSSPILLVQAKYQEESILSLQIVIENQKQLIETYEDRHKNDKEVISLLEQVIALKDQLIENIEKANDHNFKVASHLDLTLNHILSQQNQGGE